ncbi:two-component sensor histidine kinase [Actinoplanes sp. LDG1-06]|uniref:histidine kinase n=1 Tax=Paractinoplanes ovalisporus TaxID=2810368 RepID=A0ABS2AK22_9ACTN|nr:histidine kinase [Actinoplanes ovalisporus]MBM2620204.1 two-component sensor histidine kinase [Actinoplanes ovalisporus]
MQNNPNRMVLRRLAQLAALGAMALLGIFDIAQGLLRNSEPLGLVKILLAMAAAAVWLPVHRPRSTRLPKAAMALGGFSLLVTLLSAASAGGSSYGASWGLAESAALLGVCFVVARHSTAGLGFSALVVVGAAVSFAPLRAETSYVYVIFGLIQALAAAAAIGLGIYLRIIESSRQRAFDAVRAEQRAEFARDLHDFIAHHVTGIVVQAQGAKFIAEQDPKRVLQALDQIEQAGAETMASMRRMVGVLRDPESKPDAPLAPVAGVNDLGTLIDQFNTAGGAKARMHVDGDLGGLPVELSTSAYRVVMEALTNVRQHAPAATAADIWIRRTPEWLLVRIANDGVVPARTPAPRERPGYGLVGLTERVRAVGGRINAMPGIEGGWVVDAAFPIDPRTSS